VGDVFYSDDEEEGDEEDYKSPPMRLQVLGLLALAVVVQKYK
jgi:hypothetical protein